MKYLLATVHLRAHEHADRKRHQRDEAESELAHSTKSRIDSEEGHLVPSGPGH